MTRSRKREVKPTTTIKLLASAIEFHKREIAKHRDALRELISDAEAVADSCTDAVQSLEHAVDTLSQYV